MPGLCSTNWVPPVARRRENVWVESRCGQFAGLPTSKHIAVIVARGGTRTARGSLSRRFGSETAIPSRCFQFEKPGCFIRSRFARDRNVRAYPTKQHHGIESMSVSRSRELAVRRHTASMARALTWLRSISVHSVVPRQEFSEMSPGRINTRKRSDGARGRNDRLH
jgi:hypothetical protein